ncbi:MAG: adenylate/guanylate cyclase domain-containing protein, partial [Gaiellaceae bacterium]
MPSFLVKEGPLAGQRLDVDSVLVLGRSDADVVIDDPEMTRRHAVLRCADGVFEIEDLDSLNGTFLNGTRIKGTAELVPGDVVRLGKTVFEVETAEARDASAAAVPPEAPPPAVPPLPTPGPAAEPLQPFPARLEAPAARLAGGRCLGCEAELTPNARFCSNCGVAVDAPEPTTESQDHRGPAPAAAAPSDRIDDELRPVTALFADVVGSTSLGERLPPDEVKELIGECVNLMSRAVEQFGGCIQSYMGDGIAAFFGLPTAHEDDPERAAHAAIRILEVVAEYSRDIAAAWGVEDFNVRVGVNSGHMAVGAVGAAEQQIVALGDATNVAARLQSAAAPGTIVVGESTARRLAHRFVLESLGELSVKGRAQAVGAWRLASVQIEAQAPAPTPLVGRDAEVSRLRSGVEVLTEGRGQL